MTQDKLCRGMIGCHMLENKSNTSSVSIFEFIIFKKTFCSFTNRDWQDLIENYIFLFFFKSIFSGI